MKAYRIIFARTFLLFGLPFAALHIIMQLVTGDAINTERLTWTVLLYSTIMSLLYTAIYYYEIKSLGFSKLKAEYLTVNQRREVQSGIDTEELINRLKKEFKGQKVKMSKIDGGFLLRKRNRFYGWGGDIIKVIKKPVADNQYQYTISSRPSISWLSLDYGSNFKNVTIIERALIEG